MNPSDELHCIRKAADDLFYSAQYGEAMDRIKVWLQSYPNDSILLRVLGLCHYELGQFADAVSYLSSSLSERPTSTAFVERGNAFAWLGDKTSQLRDYDSAIRMDPMDTFARMHRALYFEELQDYSTALADINECIRGSPNIPEYQAIRTRLLERLGRNTETETDR